MDLTKRQQEIVDFIKLYSAEVKVSANRARHWQGRRSGVVLDGARPPREPRADRPAEARSDQASSDRASRPRDARGARDSCGLDCRSSVRSPPGSRCSRRRTSRSTSKHRRSPAAPRASTCCACRGESDEGRRHPRGRPGRGAPTGDGQRRRHRRGAGGRGGDREARREEDHVRLQPENASMEPIRSRDVPNPRARGGADEEYLREHAGADSAVSVTFGLGRRAHPGWGPSPGCGRGSPPIARFAAPACGGEGEAGLRRARVADQGALRGV